MPEPLLQLDRVTIQFGGLTAVNLLDFSIGPNELVGLIGPNGVGKSAVFDAITFCLYGTHRGDGNEVAPLVRHGQNGFTVGIEFEFNGTAYKVVRGRSGNKPVQSVHRMADGEWQRVPDIQNARDVTAWAQRTLDEIESWDDLSPDGKNERALEKFRELPVATPGSIETTPVPPRTQRQRHRRA